MSEPLDINSQWNACMYRDGCRQMQARAESAEAERDRLRDALIACRDSVRRDKISCYQESTYEKLCALLDTLDAAAKGQG